MIPHRQILADPHEVASKVKTLTTNVGSISLFENHAWEIKVLRYQTTSGISGLHNGLSRGIALWPRN